MQANVTEPELPPEKPASAAKRSLFIPAYIAGFLVVGLLTVSFILFAIGIDTTQIAQLRNGNTVAWTPPPTPVSLQFNEQTESELASNEASTVTTVVRRNATSSMVNLRSTPGYLGKPAEDVISQVAPGEEIEVLDGPQSANGLNWWYVRRSSQSEPIEGWIAEATASGVQILGE